MSPRIAKKDRKELPKPVIRPGTLGMGPVKNIALSFLYQGYCDVVIGHKDHVDTLYLKEHPHLKVHQGKVVDSLDVAGCLFNGLSDSFYRGKLPQVLIVLPETNAINYFLDEFLDHVDKLYALGFLFQKEDPVETLIPCTVMASNGVFYTAFLKKLAESLENTGYLSESLAKSIMDRFCRGIFSSYAQEEYHRGKSVMVESDRTLHIAGGSYGTRKILKSVFNAHQIKTTYEEVSGNPSERLELANAMSRSLNGVLPVLLDSKRITKKQAETYREEIIRIILAIGLQRKAFEPQETPEELMDNIEVGKTSLLAGDSSIMNGVIRFADALNLQPEKQFFQGLKQLVLEQMEQGTEMREEICS